ncbi:sulfate permease [Scopulibacillus darangshiensis]|uniref:Sulfate permease n=1 Tax=Scopulibacillus darangshiensis TaxID=442528 RepID=A0A4R2NNV7_9BACL|nr:inorganic phosphate transporter [Scopulibacillus darangshiensis]TCP23463.1 sulfate permease [Scopulibacillus darangshiensis]
MLLLLSVFIIAFFFAANIGASGAATSMGIAYSAQAVTRRRGIWLCAIGMFLGAILGGGEVVKTLSDGIVPSSSVTLNVTLMILIAAALTLFSSNWLGIPLSTSEVIVGAIVGLGLASHQLYIGNLILILTFWLLMPAVSFLAAFGSAHAINRLNRYENRVKKWLVIIVVGLGFIEAFSAGMNNVANAIGPLVSVDLLTPSNGILLGGLFVSLGAVVLGGRTLETNGKKITPLTLVEGGFVSGTTAILVIVASVLGVPVPMAQMTTSAILGIGTAKKGFGHEQKRIVRKILIVWAVSPVISTVLSYGLIQVILKNDVYTFVIMAGVCLSTIGLLTLYKMFNKENISKIQREELK